MIVDSFSGAAAGLPRGRRTAEHILAALRRNPRVSVWDMGEYPWLRKAIDQLEREGRIKGAHERETFPWYRFEVVDREASNAG